MASLTAIRTLREEGFHGEITVVSDEFHGCYARMLTPYYVSGVMQRPQLFMVAYDYHRQLNINMLLGSGAVGVDTERQVVGLANGRELPYDRLLVATGSRPYRPEIPGIQGKGVLGLRTLGDAEALRSLIEPGQAAVVLGAGLVSLMAAEALAHRGMKVSVVVTSGHVLSQLLIPDAAALVLKRLNEKGITVHTGRDAKAVQLDPSGRVAGVELDNGTVLPCRTLVVGKGVDACAEPVKTAGVAIGKGIRVNEFMESSVPGIFAAGDVAEGPTLLEKSQRVVATQTSALQQGKTAAQNMLGKAVRDIGALPVNYTHIGGVKVVAAGHTGKALPGDREEVQSGEGVFRRYLFRDERLVGITFVGDVTNASRMVTLIRRQQPIGKREEWVTEQSLVGFKRGRI